MADAKDQHQAIACPVCKKDYGLQIPDICDNCAWEFIFTNQKTPEFEQYIQQKITLHKHLYDKTIALQDHLQDLEVQAIESKTLLEKITKEKIQLKKETDAQKKELKALKNEKIEIMQRLENTLSDLDHLQAKLLDTVATKQPDATPKKTETVYINYRLEGRKLINISFDKPGIGIPEIMHFYFAKEDPKSREFFITKSDICILIRSSKLIAENGFYKFYFPLFMQTLEGNLEGFLYLPFPGEFKINPKIGTIKF